MLLTEEADSLFEATAADPNAWLESARSLKLGARPLFEQLTKLLQSAGSRGDIRVEILGYVRASMLVLAVACESLLKAVAARRGLIAVRNKRLNLDPSLSARGGHGLTEIARNLRLDLTRDEIDLLRRLEEYLVWAGRYPVSKSSVDFVRTRIDDNLLTFSSSDFDLSDGLFEKVTPLAEQSI